MAEYKSQKGVKKVIDNHKLPFKKSSTMMFIVQVAQY
jgi:hypothetical protein